MVGRFPQCDRDLEHLARIVDRQRPDLPEAGLPRSLLADLSEVLPCDYVLFEGFDSRREEYWFTQGLDVGTAAVVTPGEADAEELDRAHWRHYWTCAPCSYPDRTGDLRSVLKIADFYSTRQWHATGMYGELYRPLGIEHELQLCLPEPPGAAGGSGRTVRLYLFRGPGADFTERDRALLLLLRPHLHEAYLDAERRRRPEPELTPRQWELLRLMAKGRTNFQIARELGLSEGTVRTHLEHIYRRLDVSNRTAAVDRAFAGRVA